MLRNNMEKMLRKLNLMTLLSTISFSIILYFNKTSIFSEFTRLAIVLVDFILISKFLFKRYGLKVKNLIYLSAIIICIKIFDGAFLTLYFRFFTDVLVLFFGGMYLLQNKYHSLTFNEMALLLFAPVTIIFVPFIFDNGTFGLGLGISIPFCFTLLWFHTNYKYKFLIKIFSLVLFAAFAFIFLPNYFQYRNSEQPQPNKTIDSRATISLIYQNIDTTSLAEIGNKIVILDVWYSGCGACFKKFPEFDAFAKEYAQDTNLFFATLNIPLEKELDTFNSFDLIKEYSFNKLQATSTTVENKWGIEFYPTLLVFDKNHKLRYKGSLNTNKMLLVNNIHKIIQKLKKE